LQKASQEVTGPGKISSHGNAGSEGQEPAKNDFSFRHGGNIPDQPPKGNK
jgi:hypothetical protein